MAIGVAVGMTIGMAVECAIGQFGVVIGLGVCAARKAFEEIGDGNIKRVGDIPQAACTDAVGTAFIFLDLLELDADSRPKLLLGHAKQPAPLTQPLPNMCIDAVRHHSIPIRSGGIQAKEAA